MKQLHRFVMEQKPENVSRVVNGFACHNKIKIDLPKFHSHNNLDNLPHSASVLYRGEHGILILFASIRSAEFREVLVRNQHSKCSSTTSLFRNK